MGAKSVATPFVCFLNSHCVLQDPDWLAKLYEQARRATVGMVGPTGSYESHYSSFRKLVGRPEPIKGRHPVTVYRSFRRWLEQEYDRRRQLIAYRSAFRPFPNPHIRTNSFMLRRDVMLNLDVGRVVTKEEAWRFESGRRGLSRQVLRNGLEVLVVGRDGRAYRADEWYESRTFRSGEQANLMIADKHTREYAEADPETRRYLTSLAWGKKAVGDVAFGGRSPSPGLSETHAGEGTTVESLSGKAKATS